MRVYIAAPFFNEEQLDFVKRIEKKLLWNEIQYFSPRDGGDIQKMNKREVKKVKREIYEDNINNIAGCDKIVAVIDDRDTGTIFEMGYAVALGIPVISIANCDHGVNIMLAEAVQAHVRNLGDMIRAISDSDFKGEEPAKLY